MEQPLISTISRDVRRMAHRTASLSKFFSIGVCFLLEWCHSLLFSFPKSENPFENACQRILNVLLNKRMRNASFDETVHLEMCIVKEIMGIVRTRK